MSRASVEFWKYEGTANDFVVLEGDAPDLDLDPREVARLCDRHRGVGADGVLLVLPPRDPSRAAARMVVRNADGSRPEMCGNGLRCVVLHLVSRGRTSGRGAAGRLAVNVETDAGLRECVAHEDGPELDLAEVTVDMGRVTSGERVRVAFGGRDLELVSADAGNPHAVTFEPLTDEELDVLGARLQLDPHFPNGVNLERVRLRPRAGIGAPVSVEVAVFERGVGRTLACGTGACAVAATLVARGEAVAGEPTEVTLPGGLLRVTMLDRGGAPVASMQGPARRVFSGRVRIETDAWRSS